MGAPSELEIAIDELLSQAPYGLDSNAKARRSGPIFRGLTAHHARSCEPYSRVMSALAPPSADAAQQHAPPLSVRMFKQQELRSVPKTEVFKTLVSSGTSGQIPSRIFLDRVNAQRQTRALAMIVADFLGKKRLPMLMIESQKTLSDRQLFSARGAGVLGFSVFGTDVTYALDDEMGLDLPAIDAFLSRHQGQEILLFGFTAVVWQYFHRALVAASRTLPLERGVLIHGGGWKRLTDEAVDADAFRAALAKTCGLSRIHNYYGMVEQTGSIFMECIEGHNLHASILSDIWIRDAHLAMCKMGEVGMIELGSVLPTSYPGHLLLSEDLGVLLGEDDCPCGRLGKYFRVIGRIPSAEIRGCSDTFVRD